MTYLERTLETKAALLERPDILERIQSIIVSHVANDDVHEPFGQGSTNSAYDVGQCHIGLPSKLALILKLKRRSKHHWQLLRTPHSPAIVLGAFEMYYEFASGALESISFRSKVAYEKFSERCLGGFGIPPPFSFSLCDNWGGTRIDRGDVGAIPYFQMVVRYKEYYGFLTEGLPSLETPLGTCSQGSDDETVENHRIIDLSIPQSLLIAGDVGGGSGLGRYVGNFGLRRRGEKYFKRANRLDL